MGSGVGGCVGASVVGSSVGAFVVGSNVGADVESVTGVVRFAGVDPAFAMDVGPDVGCDVGGPVGASVGCDVGFVVGAVVFPGADEELAVICACFIGISISEPDGENHRQCAIHVISIQTISAGTFATTARLYCTQAAWEEFSE